jgi:hypothetical protein
LCQGAVRAFTIFDPDGNGPAPAALVAAGYFISSGPGCSPTAPIGNVATWDGAAWSPAGGGAGQTVYALAVFDEDEAGPGTAALFAAGSFFPAGGGVANRIARWNGTSWAALGSGLNDTAFALAVFDDDGPGPAAPALFVGGEFSTAGGVPANRVARWNGSSWSAVGAGLGSQVKALHAFDADGEGPQRAQLFAAIDGPGAGGSVYRWDGASWTFSGSFNGGGGVLALAEVDPDDDGPAAPALYCGGQFLLHAGVTFNHVARYAGGTSWAALGAGVLGDVFGLAAFDEDGGGPQPPALYACGNFQTAGAAAASRIARWDGAGWAALDAGITGFTGTTFAYAVRSFDPDGAGPTPAMLIAGGLFNGAGGASSPNVAAWAGCPSTMPGDVNGDGAVDVADLVAVVLAWGSCPPPPASCPGDANVDGAVDVADLVLVILSWS